MKRLHPSGLSAPEVLVVYALLAAGVLILWCMHRLDFRRAAPPLFVYLGVFAADAAFELADGAPIVFRGDTLLDVTLDLSLPYYVLQFSMCAIAALWWWGVQTTQRPARGSLGRGQWRMIAVALAMLPVQVVLLVTGEPHALTDEIGVVLTPLQGCVLAIACYPVAAVWPEQDGTEQKRAGVSLE